MTLKRFLTLFALLTVLVSSLGFAAPASAGTIPDERGSSSKLAVEFCRTLPYIGCSRGA